ncbi:unnamed protein product [Calypogeia fissa]
MKELVNVFAGNPLLAEKRSLVNPQALHDLLTDEAVKAKGGALLLPVCDSKPLILVSRSREGSLSWSLAWQPLHNFGTKVHISLSSASNDGEEAAPAEGEDAKSRELSRLTREFDKVVYLGERVGIPSFAIDVSSSSSGQQKDGRGNAESMAALFSGSDDSHPNSSMVSFVDLRFLMMATDWENKQAMEELSIAGHARAITEWHKASQYCGRCGTKTVPIEAGKRRQCTNLACKQKAYPRMDPVVIMLVIDKERDRVILGRQARFASRMWSCLAGFIEAGESLEEAVRRETFEEVGIRVGEIVYHSSQPWPVGPTGMSSQLMVGFFAYAKTFDIKPDGVELEDAQWFSREQVKQALTYGAYREQQEDAILKIWQAGIGGERKKSDGSQALGLSPVYVPGPYAIAHHLIATWANLNPEVVLSKV